MVSFHVKINCAFLKVLNADINPWLESKKQKKTEFLSGVCKMLSARFELAIFRVSGERIDQLSHESAPLTELTV
jgi:hypothetical protein